MVIRSKPATEDYRIGWERTFGEHKPNATTRKAMRDAQLRRGLTCLNPDDLVLKLREEATDAVCE
jgi:hypothetical protein